MRRGALMVELQHPSRGRVAVLTLHTTAGRGGLSVLEAASGRRLDAGESPVIGAQLREALEVFAVFARSGPPGGGSAPFAFPIVNQLCMGLLYGRAGCLAARNGGFQPFVPPPVWSTIYYHKRLLVPALPY